VAIDPRFVGRTYPPAPLYEVGREKIREFAEALGDDNPVYRDPVAAQALGYPDVIAPPTFPIVFTSAAARQVYDDPELAIDYSRVVHGEQRFVAVRPITVGDRIVVTVTLDSVRPVGGHEMITTRADAVTEDGELVVTAYGTIVVRGPSDEDGAQ
jgi:acyl dehydratase